MWVLAVILLCGKDQFPFPNVRVQSIYITNALEFLNCASQSVFAKETGNSISPFCLCSEMQNMFIFLGFLNLKSCFVILHFAFLTRSTFSMRSYIVCRDALF